MNCPFYGCHLFVPQPFVRQGLPFLLNPTDGNQCGLVTGAFAPCILEDAPDWRECPRVREIRMEGD